LIKTAEILTPKHKGNRFKKQSWVQTGLQERCLRDTQVEYRRIIRCSTNLKKSESPDVGKGHHGRSGRRGSAMSITDSLTDLYNQRHFFKDQ
jgi:hypothetical protein